MSKRPVGVGLAHPDGLVAVVQVGERQPGVGIGRWTLEPVKPL